MSADTPDSHTPAEAAEILFNGVLKGFAFHGDDRARIVSTMGAFLETYRREVLEEARVVALGAIDASADGVARACADQVDDALSELAAKYDAAPDDDFDDGEEPALAFAP